MLIEGYSVESLSAALRKNAKRYDRRDASRPALLSRKAWEGRVGFRPLAHSSPSMYAFYAS